MKAILLALLFSSAIANADPAKNAEILAADNMLTKIRYILGATFREKNTDYKTIPEFVAATENLKADIVALLSEAEQLKAQAGGFAMIVAVENIRLCISSFNYSSTQYCSEALNGLKTIVWEQKFGDNWSNYPSGQKWDGFPDSLE